MKNKMSFLQQLQFQQQKSNSIIKEHNILKGKVKVNLFKLNQQQKININKMLPRGFCLIRKQQYDKLTYNKVDKLEHINYYPKKLNTMINNQNPIHRIIKQIWDKKQQQIKNNSKQKIHSGIQRKSRHIQKIKNIIQRFRKQIKNTQVQSYLNKVGLMVGLNQIQGQNKKGLLSIDTFKVRLLVILQAGKATTFETHILEQFDFIIDEFLCSVEQARKAEFQSNVFYIQKSIDKITRHLSDTGDGKAPCNWYIKRKKRPQRNQNYSQKQLLYLGNLIKKLPKAYLVGILQIIYEKPFMEAQKKVFTLNLDQINNKKIKQIQLYVKTKLCQLYQSKNHKKQKIMAKKNIKQQQYEKDQNSLKIQQLQKINEIDQIQQQYLNQYMVKDHKLFQFLQILDLDLKQEAKSDSINIPNKLKSDQINGGQYTKSKIKIQPNQQRVLQEQQFEAENLSDSSIITEQDDSDF